MTTTNATDAARRWLTDFVDDGGKFAFDADGTGPHFVLNANGARHASLVASTTAETKAILWAMLNSEPNPAAAVSSRP